MKTFKQHLSESLSSSYPVDVDTSDNETHVFQFSDDSNNEYEGLFSRSPNTDGSVSIFVEFMSRPIKTVDGTRQRTSYTSQPTGRASNPVKVYATIGSQLKSYIRKHPADYIYFTAVSDRTLRVYEMLGKRIANELDGVFSRSKHGFRIIL